MVSSVKYNVPVMSLVLRTLTTTFIGNGSDISISPVSLFALSTLCIAHLSKLRIQ